MPLFHRVAIVGVGLIGGSLGLAMRERHLAQTVVGVGRNASALSDAKARGAIDVAAPDFASGVVDCDLVVLATPVPQIIADIERLVPRLAPHAVVTDVGSIKGDIVVAGDRFLPGAFVGSHPMAGSEKAGVENARADLFASATWAVTPTEHTPPAKVAQIEQLARAVGAQVLTFTPAQHDRAVALTSHLPHLLAYALFAQGRAAQQSDPRALSLAAGSWASATRVAQSDPALWQGIALANRPELLRALTEYQDQLAHLRAALETADADSLLAAFEHGHRAE